MGLYERKSAVLDGDFEWVCSTITSQNIYGRTPMIILLTMRPSRLFVKIRCHAVASTRKISANRGQVTRTTPELAPHLLTTTSHQWEDVGSLDRLNMDRTRTRRVFSGTRLELVTCQPRSDRYLGH
ncbi:hypothetical protein TNCV_2036281 [Trichonephila clavipes]|nr:hypothetical protein TNCV_2036281 [Trichonephila clavipes]